MFFDCWEVFDDGRIPEKGAAADQFKNALVPGKP